MNGQENIFAILAGVALVIVLPTAVVAFYRILRANSRSEYLKNIALFVLPILAVFALANLGGLFPDQELSDVSALEVPSAKEVFSKMPIAQVVLLGIAGVIWIIGGNILCFLHKQRVGKSWWQVMNPINPPFKDFNMREWSILAILFISSLALGVSALSFSETSKASHNKRLQLDAAMPRD